jgi:hypothetical protein
MKQRLLTVIALLPLLAFADLAEAQLPPGNRPAVVVPPAEQSRGRLIWPGKVDREALFSLVFAVTAEGKATNIRLAEGGFHEERFVKAATRMLEQTVFIPATQNGTPVYFPSIRIPLAFQIGLDDGVTLKAVSEGFRREMDKITKLIRTGDAVVADKYIEQVISSRIKFVYEYRILLGRIARTYAGIGNTRHGIESLRLATVRGSGSLQPFRPDQPIMQNDPRNYDLPADYMAGLLTLRLQLTASQGLYLEALQTWHDLAGLVEIPPQDERAVLAGQIREALLGDAQLVAKLWLNEKGSAEYALSRTRFTLDKVQGEIAGMCLVCDSDCRTLRYEPGVTWSIPPDRSSCELTIEGKPGTTFELIEQAATG